MFFYIAVHQDKNTGYGVTVPGLPGCFSYGDTLEEAVSNNKEAVQFHLEAMLDDGEDPVVRQQSLDSLAANPDYANARWFGIELDITHLTLKPERFNVSWPKYILDKVDRYVQLTHDNRSNFLAKAALEKINHLHLSN